MSDAREETSTLIGPFAESYENRPDDPEAHFFINTAIRRVTLDFGRFFSGFFLQRHQVLVLAPTVRKAIYASFGQIEPGAYGTIRLEREGNKVWIRLPRIASNVYATPESWLAILAELERLAGEIRLN